MPTFAQNDDDEDDDQTSDEPAEASSEESSDDSGAGEASSEDDAGGESPPADLEPKAGGEAGQLPPPDTDKQQAMRDYLAKQYDKAADPSAVKAALADSQRMNRAANVGSAVEGLFRARSQAYGGDGVDEKYYDRMRAEGAQGVQQAQAARDAQIKDFLTKQQLGRQAAQDQQTQAIKQQQIDAGDPSSRSSQIARAAFSANFPDIAQSMGNDFANLSTQDLSKISQITDTKAKLDAAKEMARARIQQGQIARDQRNDMKNREQNIAFGKGFAAEENKYAAAQGKIDETLSMVDQATKGGVASQLVPLEVAKGIAGRLNPQEIAAATGDPSIAAKFQRFWDKANEGQMTVKDAPEYRALLQSQKDGLASVRQKQRDMSVKTYAKTSGQPEDVVRGLVSTDEPEKTGNKQAGASQGAGGGKPAPHGDTVTQGGVTYKWDGTKYQPQPATAAAGGGNGGGI